MSPLRAPIMRLLLCSLGLTVEGQGGKVLNLIFHNSKCNGIASKKATTFSP